MNKPLRDELLARLSADQDSRRQFQRNPTVEAAERSLAIDRANSTWLRQVLDEQGWPGMSLVGIDGAEAAFLLAQHAPHLDFQRSCLLLLQQAVADGEAEKRHLAYLTDRVRVREGRPQLYGTQAAAEPLGSTARRVPAPMDDEATVDERRRQMELPPLDEQMAALNRDREP